ncbi:hypothetical protein HUU05_27375 [candidate division KSB1 bacterium]|nr:hypothetical protein [candidate division KSB1 bacterium]
MTTQALLITAIGGILVLALLGGMWWRLYRRNRRARKTEVGKSTIEEIKSRKSGKLR